MKGFRNCNVYVYNKGIVNCSLGFEDGIIKYIGDDQNMITEPIEIAKNAFYALTSAIGCIYI